MTSVTQRRVAREARSGRRWLRCLLALIALTAACGGTAPDLVVTNARVFTNDTARPWAAAIAIKGERVVGIGDAAAIAAMSGPTTRVIDAGGRVAVPGFNDARVDLPLDEAPTPAALSALDRAAIAQGVTSLQVVAGGPMRTLVDAARQAQRQARWRLIRSPMDGEQPQDEEPFLPPQPAERLLANGVAWQLSLWPRKVLPPARVSTVVGWAYGAEDPLIVTGDSRALIDALSGQGLPDVWRRKRPRLDLLSNRVDPGDVPALARFGVVVTLWHSLEVSDAPPGASAGALLDAGIILAAGSTAPEPRYGHYFDAQWRLTSAMFATLAPAVGRDHTREEGVRAATWGSAFAEKAERDKGWLAPGTLADIAILSDDVFTVPAERLAGITSVLTLVGGAIVYDAGVLPSRP